MNEPSGAMAYNLSRVQKRREPVPRGANVVSSVARRAPPVPAAQSIDGPYTARIGISSSTYASYCRPSRLSSSCAFVLAACLDPPQEDVLRVVWVQGTPEEVERLVKTGCNAPREGHAGRIRCLCGDGLGLGPGLLCSSRKSICGVPSLRPSCRYETVFLWLMVRLV